MTFDPIASPIDYVIIEEKKTPGIAEIVGAGLFRKWIDRYESGRRL